MQGIYKLTGESDVSVVALLCEAALACGAGGGQEIGQALVVLERERVGKVHGDALGSLGAALLG